MSQPMSIRIADLPQQQRVTRSPKHTFMVEHRPYAIQPFMIAPVLPAETMTHAVMQARAKTHPLASGADLFGWWLEHFLFYVKLTDLEGREDFQAMLLDASTDLSGYDTAFGRQTYHCGDGIDWVQLCLDRVVEEWFRDEGDPGATIDSLPKAHVLNESWLDSAKLESTVIEHDQEFPGQEPVVPDEYASFGPAYAQWEHMRALKLTAATFEDWVAAFGIKTDTKPEREDHRPELLRYSRDWQYPSTIVDGDGTSTSAVIWNMAERADKRRLFKEPGFIFGVTVARPKVYMGWQRGHAASMMNDAYAWLPAVLRDAPFTSLKKVTTLTGPLNLANEDYWVDLRDLFIYGDQFSNLDRTTLPAGFISAPGATLARRYASDVDIDKLFADAAGGKKYVRQDGVCNLSILGTQRDQT